MFRDQMNIVRGVTALAVLSVFTTVGCNEKPNTAVNILDQGSLRITTPVASDSIAGIQYEIQCEDGTTLSQYVELESEGLPDHVDAALAGQPFADFFSVVPPGTCTVTATPMISPEQASEDCTPAQADVVVVAEETTEIVLTIECTSPPTGAVDLVTVITDQPTISVIDYSDSKFILICEPVTITIGLDPPVDDATYTFTVVGSPPGAIYDIESTGNQMTFSAETTGEYTVTVVVTSGGSQTSMTYPIHVSDDPDVEHCYDVCCQLPDGTVLVMSLASCEEQSGTAVDKALCKEEVCCNTPQGPQVVQAYQCPVGQILPMDKCNVIIATACCQIETQLSVLPVDDCVNSGGSVLPLAQCNEEVCCKLNPPAFVSATDCPTTAVQPPEVCEPEDICCVVNGLAFVVSPAECADQQGQQTSMVECEPTICCLDSNGQYSTLPQSTCASIGGQPAPGGADWCSEVCCEGSAGPILTSLGECHDLGAQVLPAAACETVTQVWQADYTMDTSDPCEPEPYLVVPSSAANKLAVYDLDTLEPLATSPFDTCANPSRIIMDGNTDVYATCRSDGQVYKHTRDGVLLWGTQLTNCNQSRGVVLTGDLRLFAGCSGAPGRVFELDPATGAILNDFAPSPGNSMRVYGLTADSTGLYVGSYFDFRLVKFNLGGANDLTVAWDVTGQELGGSIYGIYADGIGGVYATSGSTLIRVSALDGSVLDQYSTSNWMGGVQVALNGLVYAGSGSSNQVLEYDPGTGTGTWRPLTASDNYPHGLTVDGDNNVYAINMTSSTLTKLPAGQLAPTSFGGFSGGPTILSSPYGYNGDMTGVTSGCLIGTTDVWYSSTINSNAGTTWLTISWTAVTPPGSATAVYYSTDNGTTWTQAANGQNLNVVATNFQVKVLLSATIAGNEPTLNAVTVTYQP